MASIKVSSFGINVVDLERSADFYTRVVGLHETMRVDSPALQEVMLAGDDDMPLLILVVHPGRSGDPEPGTGFDKIVLTTDDVVGLHARIVAEGLESVREPTARPEYGIVVALARDPDGYQLELVERLSETGGTAIA